MVRVGWMHGGTEGMREEGGGGRESEGMRDAEGEEVKRKGML